ncbi:hypothetical protein P375_05880 [Gallibacterium genomosp. 2]|uniref:Uncharacterized protein n=3 Tax=Gallibacterium TaxID=155493 RepID=F4HBM5_GALAU|nr:MULTISPECIES: hypothetical protein [Gallibacterium]AEC16382.1 hypothetical protein UMN179_00345 [Gallibacterium anatis UMN179]KGQ32323.1 hypothetical protein P375_05880 [Gallibacterium genomosp. 2]KGQ32713.1 hypothetical protein JP34_09085 [Gallibacterium anatis]KGQ36396.1 hypothetical protein JP35_10480 [Gallibacterium anatis]KGQ36709.1 hypothetical protein JP30_11580 [Gallibacterium anatis IPDH697-78]
MKVSIHYRVLSEFEYLDKSLIQGLKEKALECWFSGNQRFLMQTSESSYHFFDVVPHQTKSNCLVVRA